MLVWRSYVIVDILQRLPVFWSKRKKSHGYKKFSVACLATGAYSHIKKFSQVSVCSHPEVPQSQVPSQVTGPRSFPVGYPSSRFFPRSPLGGGYPSPGQGVPQYGVPPGQVRMGYTPPQPGQDGVHPPSQVRMGYPPPRDRTAERTVTTQRAVCLLHSRRRTILFMI